MAKVRVQASGGSGKQDKQDAAEKGLAPGKREPKYKGAVDVLTRVLRREGFLGWYKVRMLFRILLPLCTRSCCDILYAGNGCPDHQGGSVSGLVVYVEGPVREIRALDHAHLLQFHFRLNTYLDEIAL
jgi:hypothetical protein